MKAVKLRSKIHDHRYALWFFGFLLVYAFFIPGGLKPWREDAVVYTFHAVDYSMGFCSRFLPGAIYGALIGRYTEFAVNVYEFVLLILFFLAVSLMLERVLVGVSEKDRPYIAILTFFLLTGPYGLSLFTRRPGMLDFYWALFGIPIVFCLSDRKLYFFTVPFFALLVMTHYASILNYIPLYLLMILYKLVFTGDKKEKKILSVVFALSLAVSVGLTAYFVLFERENLVYSFDEFVKLLASRGVKTDGNLYYDYTMYHEIYDDDLKQIYNNIYEFDVFGSDGGVRGLVLRRVLSSFGRIDFSDKVMALLMSSPVAVLGFSAVISTIKKQEGRLKKIVLFCCPVLFVVAFVGGCIFSTDVNRWVAHALIGLLAFVLFAIYEGNGDLSAFFRNVLSRVPKRLIVLYMLIYCLKVVEPYESPS